MHATLALFVAVTTSAADSTAVDPSLRSAIDAYVASQGPTPQAPDPRMANMYGDAEPEAIVVYWIDDNMPGGATEGASNPANTYSRVAVFSHSGDAWVPVGRAELGQGDILKVENGIITAQSVTYAKDDPLCCPSVKRTLRLAMKNGKLVDITKPASRVGRRRGK